MQQAKQIVQTVFGYDTFRSGQEEAIERIMSEQSLLCVMPTGGGKSLCYQVPALLIEGTVLVISPLISLMKDQVDALSQLGVEAAFINSSLDESSYIATMALAERGHFQLLYVAPERLGAPSFQKLLRRLTVPFIAIDEAHCISEWGHDFRPSYRHIGQLLDQFDERPPVIALTATATPNVQRDICHQLGIEPSNIVATSVERDNLTFSVEKGIDRLAYVEQYARKYEGESGIIYAATRKTVEEVSRQLERKGISVTMYHGGLGDREREEAQRAFVENRVDIIVATNAFGMGIDQSNVRFVIHYQLPSSIEAYYQEAGRAGRDGLPSDCVLLYAPQDVQTQRFLIEQSSDEKRREEEMEKLQQIVDYVHTERCLDRYLLTYFGEQREEGCGRCSNCVDDRVFVDVTTDAQKVLSCIVRMRQMYGKGLVAQVLAGSNNQKIRDQRFQELSTYGLMKGQTIRSITQFIEWLIAEQYVHVENYPYPTLSVTEKGKKILVGEERVMKKKEKVTEKIEKDDPLFQRLRTLRMEIAQREAVPPFVIFSDRTLRELCEKKPQSLEELREIHGVGEVKLHQYGTLFLEELVLHPNK